MLFFLKRIKFYSLLIPLFIGSVNLIFPKIAFGVQTLDELTESDFLNSTDSIRSSSQVDSMMLLVRQSFKTHFLPKLWSCVQKNGDCKFEVFSAKEMFSRFERVTVLFNASEKAIVANPLRKTDLYLSNKYLALGASFFLVEIQS